MLSPLGEKGRDFVVALLVLGLAATGASVFSQEPVPPDPRPKPKPTAKPTPVPPPPPAPGPTTGPTPMLLLFADVACSVSLNGERAATVQTRTATSIKVAPGQHLLSATSEDGTRRWETVVDAKPGQQVVQIPLLAQGIFISNEDFDRIMGGVWLGVSDVKTAGAYADTILKRAWGFHDQTLSTALHTAHTFLRQQLDQLKRVAPTDAERRKIGEAMVPVGASADRYIDLMTKAVSEAQRANSWMGNPSDMYAQARALEPSIVLPQSALGVLAKAKGFKDALPVDRQVALGLVRDARDFDLGAEYYSSTPNLVAVVIKGGVAESVGLKAGDRLVSIDGQAVTSVWQLKLAMRASAGRTLEVVYERQGKRQQRELKVPARLS